LAPPFTLSAGEFTVIAGENDSQCIISRFSTPYGIRRRQCSLKVEDVVRTLASEGAEYPEVVEVLHQANTTERVTCRLANDALPQATSVYSLARAGREGKNGLLDVDPALLQTDDEIRQARTELGVTPTLFTKDTGRRARGAFAQQEAIMLRDRKAKDDKKRAEGKAKPAE
jgi:hypothetical protein